MTLKKAIEILSHDIAAENIQPFSDFQDALKLGIEALQRVETLRQHGHLHGGRPLPSETNK